MNRRKIKLSIKDNGVLVSSRSELIATPETDDLSPDTEVVCNFCAGGHLIDGGYDCFEEFPEIEIVQFTKRDVRHVGRGRTKEGWQEFYTYGRLV